MIGTVYIVQDNAYVMINDVEREKPVYMSVL